MSKAFTKETEQEDEDHDVEPALPAGAKHYMTRRGHAVLRAEFEHMVKAERPELVKVVSWAAGNGDRSENGDYIYGKKRLREIDKRIRFLTKRLENAVVVEPAEHENVEQVFFGATVSLRDSDGMERTYQIVGIDEADAGKGLISWISPLARALIKARQGDVVGFQSPAGLREIEVVEIRYE